MLNAILINKLNMAQHYLKDAFVLSSPAENAPSEQQFLVTACLNVIGAYDSRPRIGAVANVEGSLGTVVRVTQKGKFCVQLHGSASVKKISVSSLKLVPDRLFLLDKMPLNDHLVKIWAGLVMNKSTGSYLNTERKAAYGKYLGLIRWIRNLKLFSRSDKRGNVTGPTERVQRAQRHGHAEQKPVPPA